MEEKKRGFTITPTFTPVPKEVSTMSETVEETSGVHDLKDLWRKMDSRTGKLLEYAESTAKKAQAASDSALAATVRIDEQGKRITSIENTIREGHGCTQVDRISRIENNVEKVEEKVVKDVNKGIEQAGQIAATVTAIETVNSRINETNKEVEIPLEAAKHIFGYGDDNKEPYFVRLGWMKMNTDLPRAKERLGEFVFSSEPAKKVHLSAPVVERVATPMPKVKTESKGVAKVQQLQ